MKPETDLLLAKYFSGEATAEELAMLDNWLALSDDNEAYFEELTKIYEQSGMMPPLAVDKEKAFDLFEKHIKSGQKKGLTKRVIFYVSAAAVIALLIGLFSPTLFNINNKELVITPKLAHNIPHILTQGIVVTTDTSTTISYESKNDILKVIVEGKASFDITDNDKKLLVSAGETFIEDIGTVFTVTAYPESNNVMVSVESGSVRFYTLDNEGILITENNSAIYFADEKRFELIVKENISYRQPIKFNAEIIENVVYTLADYYNVDIKINGNTDKIALLTVSFSGEESIDEVLEIIAETLSLRFSKNTGTYILSK